MIILRIVTGLLLAVWALSPFRSIVGILRGPRETGWPRGTVALAVLNRLCFLALEVSGIFFFCVLPSSLAGVLSVSVLVGSAMGLFFAIRRLAPPTIASGVLGRVPASLFNAFPVGALFEPRAGTLLVMVGFEVAALVAGLGRVERLCKTDPSFRNLLLSPTWETLAPQRR